MTTKNALDEIYYEIVKQRAAGEDRATIKMAANDLASCHPARRREKARNLAAAAVRVMVEEAN